MASDNDFGPWLSTDHGFNPAFQDNGLLLVLILFFFALLLLLIFPCLPILQNHRASSSLHLPTTTVEAPPKKDPVGLDAATIRSFPVFVHRISASSSGEEGFSSVLIRESECSICLGLFEDEEMVKVLPGCFHAYHPECVDKWLITRSTCPLCRSPLDSSSSTLESLAASSTTYQ